MPHILFDLIDKIIVDINNAYRMIFSYHLTQGIELFFFDDSLDSFNQNLPDRIISFFQSV